ncbi:Abc transporter b family member 9 [Rhynchospora pubera]|uniref:Abc transporter b family member 9 n=1 Tax=Rhynchospora pubera TaxID=906938 RepID=A0AAV8C6P7_9POAL|nr:Abc transporter b family member 9 [Rhynchospora pubera]
MEGDTEKKTEESNGAEREQRTGDKGKVPLFKLFKFADGIDMALMVVGSIGAMANGLALPLTSFVFGQMVDAFGDSTIDNIIHRVNKSLLYFVYVAIGSASHTNT